MSDNEIDEDFSSISEHDGEHEHHDGVAFSRPGGSVEYGNKEYAVGLVWVLARRSGADSDSKSIKQTAIEEAPEYGGDLYCVTENNQQYGIGSTDAGHEKKMRPLATCLADRYGETFLCVFPVHDIGYYVLAVREGNINPSTDIIVEHEEEARQIFLDLVDDRQVAWANVFAPASWGQIGANEENLGKILSGCHSSIRLQEASNRGRFKTLIVAGTAIVGIGLIYFGYSLWSSHHERILEEMRIHTAQMQAKQDRINALRAIENEAWPYDNQVIGQWAIATCQYAMEGIPTIIPGWDFSSMTCSPSNGQIVEEFKRTPASNLAIVERSIKMQTKETPHVLRDTNGDKTIHVVWDRRSLFTDHHFGRHQASSDLNSSWEYMQKYFDAIRMSSHFAANIADPIPPPLTPQSDKEVEAKRIFFRRMSFSITGVETPMNYMQILSPLKSMTVSSVTLSYNEKLGNFVWDIKGDLWQSAHRNELQSPSSTVAGHKVIHGVKKR